MKNWLCPWAAIWLLKFFSQKTKGRQMSQISVTFHKLIQDSQEFGSDDEHMVSRAFFKI